MAKSKEKQYPKIITPECRFSFPVIFQPKKVNESDPKEKAKYSLQMIFRIAETPESKARGEKVVSIKELQDAVAQVFLDKLGADWREKIKQRKGDGTALYKVPFRDGNAPEKKEKPGYGFGTIFLNASSEYKPGVVGRNNKDIMNPHDVYGGCYGRAEIVPHWYSVLGNEGVSFWLQNVQKSHDGEMLSGRERAADVFDALPGDDEGTTAAASSTGSDPLLG